MSINCKPFYYYSYNLYNLYFITHCFFSLQSYVTKMKNIVCTNESLLVPPAVLLCLNLTTSLNSKTHQNEVSSFLYQILL